MLYNSYEAVNPASLTMVSAESASAPVSELYSFLRETGLTSGTGSIRMDAEYIRDTLHLLRNVQQLQYTLR